MTTTHNPDGTVTVTTAGHHRLSELRDTAATAFAEDRGTAVDWPVLHSTAELDAETFAATYRLVK